MFLYKAVVPSHISTSAKEASAATAIVMVIFPNWANSLLGIGTFPRNPGRRIQVRRLWKLRSFSGP